MVYLILKLSPSKWTAYTTIAHTKLRALFRSTYGTYRTEPKDKRTCTSEDKKKDTKKTPAPTVTKPGSMDIRRIGKRRGKTKKQVTTGSCNKSLQIIT